MDSVRPRSIETATLVNFCSCRIKSVGALEGVGVGTTVGTFVGETDGDADGRGDVDGALDGGMVKVGATEELGSSLGICDG